ncbi:hypothetical protein BDF19DRAFT_431378 [Syncephalis fuscata]|nr:hypothetical protein BDF19DRAFT_431378 [Syncephalis fuscata]
MTSHYNNILLVVLCGLPGAGKSTLIKQLDQYLTQYYDNCPLNNAIWTKCQTHVWSIDKLLPQWHMPTTAPSQVESTFKQDRHMIQTQVEACLQQLTSMAVTNQPLSHILFVDDNMYYTSMRHTYYQLAQKYKVTFLQLWLECDLVTALKRNSQRTSLKQCVPDDIIRRMAKRFEPPQSPLHFQSNSTDNDMNTTHTILLDHSIQAWEYNTVTWLSANKNVHDAHQVTRWIGESFWPAWQWAACRQQIYQQQNELTKQQTVIFTQLLLIYLFIIKTLS